jgi:putative FmdB family regulatory protein
MPLYEYRCLDCNRLFERLVRSWNEATSCPTCASEQVEKQVSTFAFAGTDSGSGGMGMGGGGGSCCGRGGCGCH